MLLMRDYVAENKARMVENHGKTHDSKPIHVTVKTQDRDSGRKGCSLSGNCLAQGGGSRGSCFCSGQAMPAGTSLQ
jgi:hypothetical protein